LEHELTLTPEEVRDELAAYVSDLGSPSSSHVLIGVLWGLQTRARLARGVCERRDVAGEDRAVLDAVCERIEEFVMLAVADDSLMTERVSDALTLIALDLELSSPGHSGDVAP
jgi:hypothetical protein